MKRFDIRKYTVLLLVCFLSFITYVSADTETSISSIGYKETKLFASYSRYGPELTCQPADPNNTIFVINKTADGYTATYDKVPSSNGDYYVNCRYVDPTSYEEKNFQYHFSYSVDNLENSLSFNLDNYDESSSMVDLTSELGIDKVVSLTIDNGSEYFNNDCSSGSHTCIIKMSKSAPQVDDVETTGKIVYTVPGSDAKVTTHLSIKIYKSAGARAVPGEFGSCEFDSNYWEYTNGIYKSKALNGVPFPECKPKAGAFPPLVFVGWVKIPDRSYIYGQTTNVCASGNYEVKTGTFDVEPNIYYFACFKYASGVALYPNGAKVSVDSSWQRAFNGAYFKSASSSGETITLPEATFEGNSSSSKKFEGWKSNSDGKIYQPGANVPADGTSYTAMYTATTEIRDFRKTIYVNENTVLKPSGVKVTKCTSGNSSYVKVISGDNTNDCILQGVAATEKNSPVEVTLYGENEYQRTFYVSVVSRVGRTSGGDNPFVIDVNPNIISTYNDYTSLNGYQTDSCNSYTYEGYMNTSNPYATNDARSGKITVYRLKSTCTGESYYSLCLDAGRASPEDGSAISYSRKEDIAMNSDFGKLLTYMAAKGYFENIKSGSIDDIHAANVVIRIVAILDGMAVNSTMNSGDPETMAAYTYYEELAAKIKSHLTSDNKINRDELANDLSDANLRSGVYDKVYDILYNYQYDDVEVGGTFQRTIDDVQYDINGSEIKITYTGTMTIPGVGTNIVASLEGFDSYSSAGIRGVKDKFEINTAKSNETGRTVYDYVVHLDIDATKLEIPSSSNQSVSESAVSARLESRNMSFKLTYQTNNNSVSDVFIAEAGSEQRMLAFEPHDVTLYIYFSPSVQSNACNSIPQLNPDNCMDDSCTQISANGSFRTTTAFNPSLFKASGCCNLITDEEKYSYIMENVCNSTCTNSTMPPVCDYRPEYTGSPDIYDIHEGKNSDGTYKIGGNKSCIVNTDAFTGTIEEQESAGLVTRYDDAGNSLMVDDFRSNRYCRVSCSEDWQLAMDSYGNYVGKNAIAAGSYFAVNKNDMFISGKRTCYSTFIDYGSYQVEGDIGSFSGFTADVARESDNIVAAYNNYSNLSHVYSDLGGDGNGLPFDVDNAVAIDRTKKYCYKWTVEYYCDEDDKKVGDSNCVKDTSTYGTVSKDASGKNKCSSDYYELVEPENGNPYCIHRASETYEAHTYNKCDDDGWAFCVIYSLSTSNALDDNDTCGTGGGETGPGEYCKNVKDTSDNQANGSGAVIANPTPYDDVLIVSGSLDESGMGYVYDSEEAARADGANDNGFTSSAESRSAGVKRLGTEGDCTGTAGGSASVAGATITIGNENNFVKASAGEGDVCDKSLHPECNTNSNDVPDASAGSKFTLSCDGKGGKSCDRDAGVDFREAVMSGFNAEAVLKGYSGQMQRSNNLIIDYAEDMFDCQHFELYNSSDSFETGMANNQLSTANFLGTKRQFKRIVSAFSPSISYTYDENEYMTILGDDNVMERFRRLNSSFYGGDCASMTNLNEGREDCYDEKTNNKIKIRITSYANGSGEGPKEAYDLELARNYLELYYYDLNSDGNRVGPQTGWAPNDKNAISYGEYTGVDPFTCGGSDCDFGEYVDESDYTVDKRTLFCVVGEVEESITTMVSSFKGGGFRTSVVRSQDPRWSAGFCYVMRINYAQANYIKASIENSSFYKNKGYWFENNEDVKEHGDNLTEALMNAAERENPVYYDLDAIERYGWTILGDYNVFPIKMTTARNIYQYTYTFADVGSYSSGQTGRIMGSDQSLISTNNRTCFYEVFEEICLCCGNPINSHISGGGLEDPQEWVTTHTPYAPSKTDYDEDDIRGTLSFHTSTVSLSDMRSDNERELGNNWSDDSLFTFNGSSFSTEKGSELLKVIESNENGENIYSKTPEYSYTLRPAGLKNIRDYNDDHSYELNHTNLTSVARYSMVPYNPDTYSECDTLTGCMWDVPMTDDEDDFRENRLINFSHFTSNFLNEFIPGQEGIEVNYSLYDSTNLSMNENCYVEKGFTADQLKEKQQSCRWVDYVQHDDDTDRYFRLSFK